MIKKKKPQTKKKVLRSQSIHRTKEGERTLKKFFREGPALKNSRDD